MGKKRTFADDSSSDDEEVASNIVTEEKSNDSAPVAKKARPLPAGYTCKICGAEEHHAVYDCPHKVKNYGVAKESASSKSGTVNNNGNDGNDPSAQNKLSVFISGLPFDLNRDALLKYLIEEGCDDTLTKKHIKLVMFEDNPKKCKGLAYVKFPSEEALAKCIAISGKKFGPLNLSIERVESSKPKATKTTHRAVVAQGKNNSKRCFRCGMHHDPLTCNNPRICYRCKSTEHLSKDCPMKKQT